MALEKFIYVNADGFYEEDDAAIQTSAGVADADKLVKTSSDGKIDPSLFNFQSVKRYFVADVATTANISLSGEQTIDGVLTSASRVLVKDQTTDSENGIYLSAAGAWSRVIDYDNAAEIVDGTAVAVGLGTVGADKVYLQVEQVVTVGSDSINFVNIGTNSVEAGDGISKSGNTLSADLLASGGIKFVGVTPDGELAVEPSDFAGAGLIDDGADNLAIDWSTTFNDAKAIKAEDINSTANGEGASIVGIEDSAGNFTSTDVEGALAELYTLGSAQGTTYTVGTGGVTIGDLVYISANDTVQTYSTLANAEYGIGIAASTESAAGSVVVLANDTIGAGLLSGATAGDIYFWDGSALTTTIPSGGGSHVWRAGIASNATDLHVEVLFVKKNK